MSDHNNPGSALLAPQPQLLPAAEVFPATQRPPLPPAFLPVPIQQPAVFIQQPAVLPENRPILIDQYPFDTLPLYNRSDYRSPAERWRTLPHPIDMECGMIYVLAFKNAFMLYSWIKGPSTSASDTSMYDDAWQMEKSLVNEFKTFPFALNFNKRLEKEKARLRPLILAEMQNKNCCFSCLVHGRETPCHHPYPQRPTEAANGQGGVQNKHGERVSHVQRGESSTARSGVPQPIPPATPAIRTVGGINTCVAQLTTQWDRTEGALLAGISHVAFHGIIVNEGQQLRDLNQVLSWIDDFVLTAKHRFDEVRALLLGFWTAVVPDSNGNTRTPAPSPCLNSRRSIREFTRALQERLIVGILKILVPLFTFHPNMGTTEALLMLRIEGCRRGWIPFLTEVLRVAFGGGDGAEIRYLRTRARNRELWKFWRMVVMGNRWAIDAIADPRCIPNGLSTSSLKVYLMPMGWDGKGWEGLASWVTNGKPAWFLKEGVSLMVWEMGMQMSLLPSASRGSRSQSSQQPGARNNHDSNSNDRHPPPQPSSSQMNPMAHAGNYGQQPQQNGNGYGGMYASPPGPPPNGHNPPPAQANGYGGSSGCGCGCGAQYGCGSRKRRREEGGEEDAFASGAVPKRVKVLRNQDR